jgi:hypothetical protein
MVSVMVMPMVVMVMPMIGLGQLHPTQSTQSSEDHRSTKTSASILMALL